MIAIKKKRSEGRSLLLLLHALPLFISRFINIFFLLKQKKTYGTRLTRQPFSPVNVYSVLWVEVEDLWHLILIDLQTGLGVGTIYVSAYSK